MGASRRPRGPRFGGVDPGKDGWLVVYDGRKIIWARKIPWLDRVPDRAELKRIFLEWKDLGVVLVAVEFQQPMGAESAKSAFTAGRGYESLLMGLEVTEIPVEEPRPATWKPAMGVRTPKTKVPAMRKKILKQRAIARCQSLLPGYDLKATPKCKGPDHNKAEACLLAVYAQRIYLGEIQR